jgi:transposase
LKRLGIDEIALIKRKGNYCAVLIDLEKSKLIGMMDGRTQEEIREVLLGWEKEVLEQIEEEPYRFMERLQKCSDRADAKCPSGRRQISCNGTNK